MSIADDKRSEIGAEKVVGFDNVTLRVSSVQYEHNSSVGSERRPPVAFRD